MQHLQKLELHRFDGGGCADDDTASPHGVRELLEHTLVDFRCTVAGKRVDTLVHDG